MLSSYYQFKAIVLVKNHQQKVAIVSATADTIAYKHLLFDHLLHSHFIPLHYPDQVNTRLPC